MVFIVHPKMSLHTHTRHAVNIFLCVMYIYTLKADLCCYVIILSES